MGRPSIIEVPHATVYDWLAANGVDEWVPDSPIIEVDPAAATIRYTAYEWLGPRGWDPEHLRVVTTSSGGRDVSRQWRTVALRVPPSPDVLLAALVGGAAIIGAE